jgi:chromosome segregation ATPase
MQTDKSSNGWASPAIVISLVTLVVSIVINIYQYFHSLKNLELNQQKASAEILDLKSQIHSRDEQLRLFIEEAKRIDLKRAEIEPKLEKIEKEIEVWSAALDRRNLDLSEAEMDLQRAESSGDLGQIEREKEFLSTIKMYKEYTQSKLEQSKKIKEDLIKSIQKE